MWWVGILSPREVDALSFRAVLPGGSCLTVGNLRCWHGPPEPALTVRREEGPGCGLLVVGCCTMRQDDLRDLANRLEPDRPATEVLAEALARLDGSRAIILVRPDEVVATGDLAGQHPVFYTHTTDHGAMMGSHATILADRIGWRLDIPWLAARWLLPGLTNVWWTGTPWRDVRALRPGWALRIRRGGVTTTTPLVRLPRPDRDLVEGGTALRSALVRAVDARIARARRPTVELSGGLDSSTIAVLAAKASAQGLPALTMAFDEVEDAEPAAELATEVPGLCHERLDVPRSALPYSGLDEVPALDEPDECLVTAARERWWMLQVARRGSDLHLTGDGGDAVLMAAPAYLIDLATPRRLPRLWQHVTGWARLRCLSPLALARTAVATRRIGYETALHRTVARLLDPAPEPSDLRELIAWFTPDAATRWARPEARHVAASMIEEHARHHPSSVVPGEWDTGEAIAWLGLNALARSQRLYAQMARSCGVNLHAPYLDDGVVRAAWSVPAWVRTDPERYKPLLAAAVRNLVPGRLLNRCTKGDYTQLAYLGLRENADALTDLLTHSRLGGLGLLDERKVVAELRRAGAGLPIRLGTFDAVIGMELWLRSLDTTAGGHLRAW